MQHFGAKFIVWHYYHKLILAGSRCEKLLDIYDQKDSDRENGSQ